MSAASRPERVTEKVLTVTGQAPDSAYGGTGTMELTPGTVTAGGVGCNVNVGSDADAASSKTKGGCDEET